MGVYPTEGCTVPLVSGIPYMTNRKKNRPQNRGQSSSAGLRQRLKPMQISQKQDGSIRVRGTELIASAQQSTSTAQGEVLFELFAGFDPAPALDLSSNAVTLGNLPSVGGQISLSRLSYIARLFEKWRTLGLKIHVVSTASNLASGGYIQTFLTDPLDFAESSEVSIVQAMTREHSVMAKVSESSIMKAPVDPSSHYFVSSSDLEAKLAGQAPQARLAYAGIYQLVAEGPASSTINGADAVFFILLEYDIEFMNPTVPEPSSIATSEPLLYLLYAADAVTASTVDANEGVTVIATTLSSGSLLLDPGIANNGTFRVWKHPQMEYPPWWNPSNNTFARDGRYLVAINTTINPQSIPNPGFGPIRSQLNTTSTYSDTRTSRLVQTTWNLNGSNYSTCRDGLGSAIGSSATANSNSSCARTGGLYELTAYIGDRFDFYLNGSAASAGSGPIILSSNVSITIDRIGDAPVAGGPVLRLSDWSYPEWYDRFGGITSGFGTQLYGSVLSAVNSTDHPFDSLTSPPYPGDWRQLFRDRMQLCLTEDSPLPLRDVYDQFLSEQIFEFEHPPKDITLSLPRRPTTSREGER